MKCPVCALLASGVSSDVHAGGETYYHNERTGESTWAPPPGAEQLYSHNERRTGEPIWEPPDEKKRRQMAEKLSHLRRLVAQKKATQAEKSAEKKQLPQPAPF